MEKTLNWLRDYWPILIGGVATLFIAQCSHAEVTPVAAMAFCQAQTVAQGGELITAPLAISGPAWQASWGDTIPGDTITLHFANDTITLSEQSSIMGDHVLTIFNHRTRGIEVFAARFNDGDAKVVMLVIPLKASLAGDTPSCFKEWLVR